MIYLIVGENYYRLQQEIVRITKNFRGDLERYSGADIDAGKLADIMGGTTLFSSDRTAVIRDLSANSALWEVLPNWVARLSDSTTLILVEGSVDKRTKTYKALKSSATVIEVPNWQERDYRDAEAWLDKIAHTGGVILSRQQLSSMVRRATHASGSDKKVIDQTMLAKAIQSLSGMKKVSDEDIAAVLPDDANENVYELLSAAINGDSARVERMLTHLKATDDPFRLFALIASQWFQLVALSVTTNSSQEVAQDLNVHPFVIQKLSAHRTRFSRHELRVLSDLMARLDLESKTTSVEPWHSVERFLLGVLDT